MTKQQENRRTGFHRVVIAFAIVIAVALIIIYWRVEADEFWLRVMSIALLGIIGAVTASYVFYVKKHPIAKAGAMVFLAGHWLFGFAIAWIAFVDLRARFIDALFGACFFLWTLGSILPLWKLTKSRTVER